MPLYANGTLIPENVANALTVNGVNITQVIANGVEVWKQSLFPTMGWSGNSYSNRPSDIINIGLQTSGVFCRMLDNKDNEASAWMVTASDSFSSGTFAVAANGTSGSHGFKTSGFTWTSFSTFFSSAYLSGIVTYTIGVGFAGNSYFAFSGNVLNWQTSSGLLRFVYDADSGGIMGAWISLT